MFIFFLVYLQPFSYCKAYHRCLVVWCTFPAVNLTLLCVAQPLSYWLSYKQCVNGCCTKLTTLVLLSVLQPLSCCTLCSSCLTVVQLQSYWLVCKPYLTVCCTTLDCCTTPVSLYVIQPLSHSLMHWPVLPCGGHPLLLISVVQPLFYRIPILSDVELVAY